MLCKIYSIGSNDLLTNEIKDITEQILEYKIPVTACLDKTLKNHLDGDLYVCNKSLYNQVSKHIPEEKIINLNLQPTSQFYLQLAAIPANSDVYVFHNKTIYLNTLIDLCKSMGLDKFNYIPIPYATLPLEKVEKKLNKAKYVIGLEILLKSVLFTKPYNAFLLNNPQIIDTKRVASVETAGRVIKKVNEIIYYKIINYLETILQDFSSNNLNATLYRNCNAFDSVLEKISAVVLKTSKPSSDLRDLLLQSAMYQLNPSASSAPLCANEIDASAPVQRALPVKHQLR